MASMFQSTRPGRSATSCDCGHLAYHIVSIHAPRAERDDVNGNIWKPLQVFQSTRPGRSATYLRLKMLLHISCFNPRAPGGARPPPIIGSCVFSIRFQSTRPGRSATLGPQRSHSCQMVSIHAPRAERDDVEVAEDADPIEVSIHAPRAERDLTSGATYSSTSCFNPRAPGGARPDSPVIVEPVFGFQSTRPGRSATCYLVIRLCL